MLLDYRDNERRVTTTSNKDKEKKGVALFSNDTDSFFFFFVPFLPLLLLFETREYPSIDRDS
jgi:hypothetical protein